MFSKQFKDPIYGYIEIDSGLVSDIIDTPTFQRLKDIRQTSYTPLYPGAYHNRYIHSLGVYHLGRMAFRAIKPQLEEISKETNLFQSIDKIQETFELACLLHDVGHAPFSHTGETFFLDKSYTLYSKLKSTVNDDKFTSDFDALGVKKPAPHECMSCIVGIEMFHNYFTSASERALFARCIIGMPIHFNETPPEYNISMPDEQKKEATRLFNEYKARKTEAQLLNCIISLLNSSIIDVDRLDYIIRDAATIGFKNAQVDYMRLLSGMRILEYEKTLCIGYHKSALSVIESAVYAHDAEKKWVQGHPSILYEMEALKHAMAFLTKTFSTPNDVNPLFCYEALTEQGKNLTIYSPIFTEEALSLIKESNLLSEGGKELANRKNLFKKTPFFDEESLSMCAQYTISLLADEDFLFLMKQFCKDGFGYEYFARNRRRLAVWKSEAEFRALFQERIGRESAAIKTLEADFESLMDYCQSKTGAPIVTSSIYDILNKEENDANDAKENAEIPEDSYEDIINGVKVKRYWVGILEKLAQELDIEFEFLIVFQKKFNSSFKASIGKIPILFPNLQDGPVPLENVVDVLRSSADHRSNFFHLFYRPKSQKDTETQQVTQVRLTEEKKKAIVSTIAKGLIKAVNDR